MEGGQQCTFEEHLTASSRDTQALSIPELQASARKWPELFSNGEVQAKEAQVEGKMRIVRPVVETGWGCGFISDRCGSQIL